MIKRLIILFFCIHSFLDTYSQRNYGVGLSTSINYNFKSIRFSHYKPIGLVLLYNNKRLSFETELSFFYKKEEWGVETDLFYYLDQYYYLGINTQINYLFGKGIRNQKYSPYIGLSFGANQELIKYYSKTLYCLGMITPVCTQYFEYSKDHSFILETAFSAGSYFKIKNWLIFKAGFNIYHFQRLFFLKYNGYYDFENEHLTLFSKFEIDFKLIYLFH